MPAPVSAFREGGGAKNDRGGLQCEDVWIEVKAPEIVQEVSKGKMTLKQKGMRDMFMLFLSSSMGAPYR